MIWTLRDYINAITRRVLMHLTKEELNALSSKPPSVPNVQTCFIIAGIMIGTWLAIALTVLHYMGYL